MLSLSVEQLTPESEQQIRLNLPFMYNE